MSNDDSHDVFLSPLDEKFSSESAPYKLIQLPSEAFLNELMKDYLERGNFDLPLLYLKENEDGFVNCCSNKETFELLHVEHSNQMYLGKIVDPSQNVTLNILDGTASNSDAMIDIEENNRNEQRMIDGMHESMCEAKDISMNDSMDLSDFPVASLHKSISLDTIPIKNMYELNAIPGLLQRISKHLGEVIPSIDLELITQDHSKITDISMSELLNTIPASRNDIELGLKYTDAVEIRKNHYIQLNDTSMRRTIVYLILLLQYMGEKTLTMDTLRDTEILKPEWAVQVFSSKPFEISEFGVTEAGDIEIDRKKLAVYYAEKILFFKKQKFKSRDFLSLWQKKLDGVCDVRLEWIYKSGMCLLYDDENVILQHADCIIEYFPKSRLSYDPKTRFAELFNKKKIWKASHLSTYLQDIATEDMPVDKLIQKYAKSNQTIEGSEKMYIIR